jgi:hypothetical protein
MALQLVPSSPPHLFVMQMPTLRSAASVDSDTLSQKVGAILGCQVRANLEDGTLTVLHLGTFQFLLHTSKLPRAVTPEWVVAAIARKEKSSEELKVRRAEAVKKLHEYMTAKGLRPNHATFYFTSFGFSVENLFMDGLEEAQRLLDASGITCKRLEYSAAHWVVRVIL